MCECVDVVCYKIQDMDVNTNTHTHTHRTVESQHELRADERVRGGVELA
jgi:hypothetical protein